MKRLSPLFFIVISISIFVSCGGSSRTVMVKRLASFEVKTDLATKQLYLRLSDNNQLGTRVNALIKCGPLKKEELNELKKLDVKVKSSSGDIYSISCPARSLPELADLSYVTTIEAARKTELK